MKKIMLFATVVAMSLAVVMPVNAQSRKEKKAAQKEQWEMRQQFIKDSTERANKAKLDAMDKDQRAKDDAAAKDQAYKDAKGVEMEIPCVESSFDDEEYFRDLGIGTDEKNNRQAARLDAVKQAKAMIKARLGEYIQGVTTDYFNSYTASASDDVQHKMESKLNGVVDYMLNNADKECEKAIWNVKGNYEYYYVVRIPKADMKKKMIDAIKEAKLEIDFHEQQMQKFMDENMDKMLEEKRKAGY